jgi:hypothetical protein
VPFLAVLHFPRYMVVVVRLLGRVSDLSGVGANSVMSNGSVSQFRTLSIQCDSTCPISHGRSNTWVNMTPTPYSLGD